MDTDRSSLLSEFINVTAVEKERAQFYLESSAWKLDIALARFFDEGPDADELPPPVQPPVRSASPPPQRTSKPSRFGTIGGLKQAEKKDENQGNEYYAGGSEESGEVIIGPSKKKNASKFVEDMMKAARDHGAEEVPSGGANEDNFSPAFIGSGFRLGESEQMPSQMVHGKQAPPRRVAVVLKLWKNGFSVDDGPLRDYQDKANKDFLDSIHQGSIPDELRSMARGGEVNLDMEDHREEDYVAPKQTMKAFSGAGQMLGSPAPSVVSQTSPALAERYESMAKEKVVVDSTQPTTQLQIRLSDGSRLIVKFNHSHTVSDVRNYILTARPQLGAGSFTLLTTFPNKEITNEQQTLAEAQLLNAVIVQKMK